MDTLMKWISMGLCAALLSGCFYHVHHRAAVQVQETRTTAEDGTTTVTRTEVISEPAPVYVDSWYYPYWSYGWGWWAPYPYYRYYGFRPAVGYRYYR